MAMFNSYVKLPEGINKKKYSCWDLDDVRAWFRDDVSFPDSSNIINMGVANPEGSPQIIQFFEDFPWNKHT